MNSFVPNRKILYVDDEVNLLSSFRSLMRKEDVETYLLQDSTKIKDMLEKNGPYAVVLSDQRMPGLTGAELLEKVANIHPQTLRVLVTGYSDYEEMIQAINNGGISHYITKPWKDDELKKIIKTMADRYNLISENKFLLAELKVKNSKLKELLDGTVLESTHLLVDVLSYINPHAASQTDRVKAAGLPILDKIDSISHQERWEISIAFDLFNLGFAVLPTWVQLALNKEGLAAASRFSICNNHHLLAAQLLERIPGFEGAAKSIQLSRKDFDGTGSPEKIHVSGKDLPLGARLLKIFVDLDRRQSSHFKDIEILKAMVKQSSKYDIDLLHLIIESYIAAKELKTKELMVYSQDLMPGMLILQTIQTVSGIKLMNPNTVLTKTSLMAIRSWEKLEGIKEPIKVEVKIDPAK
ncbi:hydrogenase transcriptional regulatory protein hupR1 [bacterium BMS3Abin03]|nr:hydrogenase transcriptional regulatory protein hupR1 [bacterium BMS3Abin03]